MSFTSKPSNLIEIYLTQPSLTRASIRRALRFVLIGAFFLMFLLRVISLDSDAYPRLSWSSALITDEGFYIHNARNLVLFGVERTDDFNNILIMPVLHWLQVAVFKIFGVGAIQARSISVGLSLISLFLFFDLMHRAFRWRVAFASTVFLGLDHIYLLYNRMALMDTPACASLISVLYALVRGVEILNMPKSTITKKREYAALGWLFASGLLCTLTYTMRGLMAILSPCIMISLYVGLKGMGRGFFLRYTAFLVGLASGIAIYSLLWLQPHHAEIAKFNAYYINRLLMPHTLNRLGFNLLEGGFNYARGMGPYLLRHSAITFCLSLLGVFWFLARFSMSFEPLRKLTFWTRNDIPEPEPDFEPAFDISGKKRGGRIFDVLSPESQPLVYLEPKPSPEWIDFRDILTPTSAMVLSFFALSLITFWVFLGCVNYAPSRYYVLFYPSMMGLAGFVAFQIPKLLFTLWRCRPLMALLTAYLICAIGQALRANLDDISVIRPGELHGLFWGLFLAFYAGSFLSRKKVDWTEQANQVSVWMNRYREALVASLILWGALNLYWTSDWLRNLTWKQRDADRKLAIMLPPDSTLLGSVAPGLCLNNHFKVVNVIPGLCNDDNPIDKVNSPAYIVILDDEFHKLKWKDRWWVERYPELVRPQNRAPELGTILRPFFYPGVYRAK